MKKIFPLFILCLICVFSVSAQNKVTQLPVGEESVPSDNSFCYALPKTTFKLDVTVTKTTELKGYFSDYAEKLLGLKNVITNNKTSYKLKEVKLSVQSLPDTNYMYAVELSPVQMKNNVLTAMAQKQVAEQCYENAYQPQEVAIPDFFKNYSDIAYIEKEDSYVETKIVDGVVVQVPVNKTKIITKSQDKQAQEAADFIVKIRNDRYDLTAGAQEVAYSKEAIEYMIQEMNRLEKNYLDLFTGLAIDEEQHFTVFVTPTADETQKFAFAVDPVSGFSKNTVGTPYYLAFQRQYNQDQYEAFDLMKWKVKNYKFNDGYRVRQAAPAYVSLTDKNTELKLFGTYPVYQFGRIITLPKQSNPVDITSFDAVIYY